MIKIEIRKLIIFLLLNVLFFGCAPFANDTQSKVPLTTNTPITPTPTLTPNPTSTPYFITLEIPQKDGEEYWPSEPLSREFYSYVDVETNQIFPIQEFRRQYAEALENNDAWIQEPILVALRYAGYPNIDGTNPNKVFVFSISGIQVVVVILAENLMNDSVRDHEDRVDLIKVGNVWQIEWAGYRQRCYRSSFDGWITGLCP